MERKEAEKLMYAIGDVSEEMLKKQRIIQKILKDVF